MLWLILVLETEFKDGLNRYLAAHPVAGQPATLQELIDYNGAHAAAVMPFFGQERFLDAQATKGLLDAEYLAARQRIRNATGVHGIAAELANHDLDALIAPTAAPAWALVLAADPGGIVASGPAAVAGFPHLTVPMGTVSGMPVGLSFFAGAWADGEVLALGYAYEQLGR